MKERNGLINSHSTTSFHPQSLSNKMSAGTGSHSTKECGEVRRRRNNNVYSNVEQLNKLPSKLQILCDNSSVRGIQKIRRAPTTFLRILWMSFVIGMGMTLLVTSAFLVRDYTMYNTAWHTSTVLDASSDFPAITICALNPFSLEANQIWKSKPILSPREFKSRLQNISKNLIQSGYADIGSRMPLHDKVEYYYASLPYNDTVALGHARSMIYLCLVTTKNDFIMADNCSVEADTSLRLRHFSHSEYFNCWTMDAQENKETDMVDGVTFLVKLIPTREVHQMRDAFMMDLLSRGEGLKVIIHERDTYPDIRRNAVNVQPGKMNQIVYEPVQYIRYSSPVSQCKNDQDPILDLDRHFQYTFMQCLDSEVQRRVMEQCGCMITDLPFRQSPQLISRNPHHRMPYCVSTVIDDVNTLKNVTDCHTNVLRHSKEIKSRVNQDTCFPRCQETTFTTTLSVSKWIASRSKLRKLLSVYHEVNYFGSKETLSEQDLEKYFEFLDKEVKNSLHANKSAQTNETDVMSEDSFTYISLFRKNDDATKRHEKLTLDVYILLSRIGGLCSLCIGLTTAFFIEVIEFIYLSIHASKQKRVLKRHQLASTFSNCETWENEGVRPSTHEEPLRLQMNSSAVNIEPIDMCESSSLRAVLPSPDYNSPSLPHIPSTSSSAILNGAYDRQISNLSASLIDKDERDSEYCDGIEREKEEEKGENVIIGQTNSSHSLRSSLVANSPISSV